MEDRLLLELNCGKRVFCCVICYNRLVASEVYIDCNDDNNRVTNILLLACPFPMHHAGPSARRKLTQASKYGYFIPVGSMKRALSLSLSLSLSLRSMVDQKMSNAATSTNSHVTSNVYGV